MKQILANILYTIMYWFGYIEMFWNKIKKLTYASEEVNEFILLISNETLETRWYSSIKDDIDMNYDFGIVQKNINDRKCQYLFQDDLDTDNIDNMFEKSVEPCFLSVDVVVNDENYTLDISTPIIGFKTM